jgi:hypothetical protein
LLDNPPEQFNHGCWLTIDPGDNTAICRWTDCQFRFAQTFKGCLNNFPQLLSILVNSSFSIIIENVNLWGGSATSYASAASGDLFKLAMLTGALIQNFKNLGATVYLVNPIKWKGQLNQEQLQHILRKKFNIEPKNEHEASAIGIGLWAKGVF